MSKNKAIRMGLSAEELPIPGGASRALPPDSIPDPEVAAKPTRRRFTADYKRSIVEQADACQDVGAIGALAMLQDPRFADLVQSIAL